MAGNKQAAARPVFLGPAGGRAARLDPLIAHRALFLRRIAKRIVRKATSRTR